jgi:hypothetical protein
MIHNKILFALAICSALMVHAQENKPLSVNLEWQQVVSMAPIEIPSNITGANLEGEVSVMPDSSGGIYLIVSNTFLYRPYSVFMLHLNNAGNITDSASIKGDFDYVPSDPIYFNGNFNLNNSRWENDTFQKVIIPINSNLKASNDKVPDYLYSTVKTDDGYLSLVSFYDSVGNVFGQTKLYTDSTIYLVKTYDFEKAESVIPLPSSSPILDEYSFKDKGNTIVGYLNNTILKGPDHHDILIYSLDKNLNLNWHRALTSKSMLGRLIADDIVLQNDGTIGIVGNANDIADFIKPGDFYEIKDKNELYTYSFFAEYDKNGKCKGLTIFDREYESMYNTEDYSILKMTDGKIILHHKQLPGIVYINAKTGKIKKQEIAVNPIQGQIYKNEVYQFINLHEFFRIAIVNGPMESNVPPKYIIQKYRLPTDMAF